MSNEETKSNNNQTISPTNKLSNFKLSTKFKHHVTFNNIIQYVDIESLKMKTEPTLENANKKASGEKCLSFCCIMI